MKKSVIVTGVVLLSALVASATEVEQYEAYLGYNFVRFNTDSDFLPSFSANGGAAQFVYNFNKWLGGVVDFGAVTRGTINNAGVDMTVLNFVAGPRFTFHKESRFRPFLEALFGGSYATASSQVAVINPVVSERLVASHTAFAMLAGGGLDIKVSKHIALRPIEANYYLARPTSFFTGEPVNRNNFRYTAGVNFLFGEQ
jgi:opacity protein-like surface antigen